MLFVFIYISLPVPNARAVSRISGLILPDAFALGIVIFSIYISMGKMLAKKHDYEVDANQVCLKGFFLNYVLIPNFSQGRILLFYLVFHTLFMYF
jgi:hypothetical protein